MFYKRYEKSEFIRDAVFENTLTPSLKRSPSGGAQLVADHSKLDSYLDEEQTLPRRNHARCFASRCP